jgi:AcrR family transcriptional regulator
VSPIGRLATELQMSKTGIFAHFGSKEQLQLATVEAAKQSLLRADGTTFGRALKRRTALAIDAGELDRMR